MAALSVELTPIVCIGETLERRGNRNETMEVLDRQIQGQSRRPDQPDSDSVGSSVGLCRSRCGPLARYAMRTPEQAAEAHAHIRHRLRQWFGGNAANQCHVIYGGSVKPDTSRRSWPPRMSTGHSLVAPASPCRRFRTSWSEAGRRTVMNWEFSLPEGLGDWDSVGSSGFGCFQPGGARGTSGTYHVTM